MSDYPANVTLRPITAWPGVQTENPRPLAEPITCKGALGLWTPPIDAIRQLERSK